jgi:hypothetical protein
MEKIIRILKKILFLVKDAILMNLEIQILIKEYLQCLGLESQKLWKCGEVPNLVVSQG